MKIGSVHGCIFNNQSFVGENDGAVPLLHPVVEFIWIDEFIEIQQLNITVARYYRCTIVGPLLSIWLRFDNPPEKIKVFKFTHFKLRR